MTGRSRQELESYELCRAAAEQLGSRQLKLPALLRLAIALWRLGGVRIIENP